MIPPAWRFVAFGSDDAAFQGASLVALLRARAHGRHRVGIYLPYHRNGTAVVHLGARAMEQLVRDNGLHCLGNGAGRIDLWTKKYDHARVGYTLLGSHPFCFGT